MNALKNKAVFAMALSAAFTLSACDKSTEVESEEAVESTSVTADKEESVDSSYVAKQMSKQTIRAFSIPLLVSGTLNDEQKTCLQNADEDLGVPETKAYLEDQYSPEELQAMNEAFSSGIMEKMNKYTEEQILIMAGQPVDNPTPPPTEAEMAEFKAMFEEDPRLQRLMEMNNSSDPEQDEYVQIIKPIVNSEFERCNIDTTI